MDCLDSIGCVIKNRRKELGLSAEYLAEKIGVSRSTIFRYENGEIEKIPTDILLPLANVLRATPAFLLGLTDNPSDDGGTALEYSRKMLEMHGHSDNEIIKALRVGHLYTHATLRDQQLVDTVLESYVDKIDPFSNATQSSSKSK